MIPKNEVTSKYLHRLLYTGCNDHFELTGIQQQQVCDADQRPIVGLIYYRAAVCVPSENFTSKSASGATPHQAVQNALIAHGVTFR